jgi:uncharacterized RDD family membrane protein YckC/Tfp pilus assembly major pilin PilA
MANSPYTVSPAALQTAAGPAYSTDPPYAGFWRRVGGYLIDYVLGVGFYIVLLIPLKGLLARSPGLPLLLFSACLWIYSAAFESSKLQATVGKLAVGIKVTDMEGQRISFGRATGRYFAQIISAMIFGVGYVMTAFTERRQALHDIIAGTLLVGRDRSQEEVADAGPAPRMSGGMIALVVIVFIFVGPFGIGIMAAIAIPAYQNYTLRAQVAEGLAAAQPYKLAIAAAAADGRPLRTINSRTLPPVAGTGAAPLRYVASVQVESGVVVITYGLAANRLIAGRKLLIVPGTNPQREVVWVCGRHTPPMDLSMAVENAGRYSDVGDQYLPSACRAGT